MDTVRYLTSPRLVECLAIYCTCPVISCYACIKILGKLSNTEDIIYLCIREYGSTLYVGLARDVSPTNTNFRLTFLLTRLQEALYECLAV